MHKRSNPRAGVHICQNSLALVRTRKGTSWTINTMLVPKVIFLVPKVPKVPKMQSNLVFMGSESHFKPNLFALWQFLALLGPKILLLGP